MEKAIEMLSEVKESIINAYEVKTGLPRLKISRLMDAETWMDANKAIELGFADSIMSRNETEDLELPDVSMLYSEVSVMNSLMDKIAAKCKITKEESINHVNADSLLERLYLIKNWR